MRRLLVVALVASAVPTPAKAEPLWDCLAVSWDEFNAAMARCGKEDTGCYTRASDAREAARTKCHLEQPLPKDPCSGSELDWLNSIFAECRKTTGNAKDGCVTRVRTEHVSRYPSCSKYAGSQNFGRWSWGTLLVAAGIVGVVAVWRAERARARAARPPHLPPSDF